ncbi:hypothetical protein PPN31114_00743 [Pandoraea pneumonica]|uniref:Lipoprotein n=1 Tax=Pandoraea pneumonica TaxID=2508299 RepID=A0A5E4SDF1_9BURK|nr:hypothetical protein [Pandoraea pneumonica]VVD73657.1 hypothetical protein PPN31114_00743 [Pandoraea pneumonica]
MASTTRSMLYTAAMATALCLAACSSPLASPDRPPAGSSAAFRAGYTLGCTAGRGAVEPTMVESRLPKDASAETQDGWKLGYQTCFDDAVRHGSPLSNRGSGA